jgi:hypothetical protein
MWQRMNLICREQFTSVAKHAGRTVVLFALSGCAGANFNFSSVTWKTYNNSRYGFEFPYPNNWTTLPAPENDDGVAFVAPYNQSVEIRGWAGNRLSDLTNKRQNAQQSVKSNFQTKQGILGVLVVEVTPQVSAVTLTLVKGQVKYYWQGRCKSEDFDQYYRFFYYIAQQYKITGTKPKSPIN